MKQLWPTLDKFSVGRFVINIWFSNGYNFSLYVQKKDKKKDNSDYVEGE